MARNSSHNKRKDHSSNSDSNDRSTRSSKCNKHILHDTDEDDDEEDQKMGAAVGQIDSGSNTNNNEEQDDDDNVDEGDDDVDEGVTYSFADVQSSPSKRKSVTDIKGFKASAAGSTETFSIELLDGGFEVIGVEKEKGQDGFFHPIKEAIEKEHPGMKSYGLIATASRRISPDNDQVLRNKYIQGKTHKRDNNNGKPYPRQYIVRAITESSPRSRRHVVDYLCRFLNKWDRERIAKNGWSEREIDRFVIPHNYDRTPKAIKDLRKLDYYLTTKSICQIIEHTYVGVSNTWAQENPKVASKYFTPPYPEFACQKLGYDNDSNS